MLYLKYKIRFEVPFEIKAFNSNDAIFEREG